MSTRNLTPAEAKKAYMDALDALGVTNELLPGWLAPFAAMVARHTIHAFCKANNLEPPPGLLD